VKDLTRTVKFVNLENKIQPKMPAKLTTCHVGIVSIPNAVRNPYNCRTFVGLAEGSAEHRINKDGTGKMPRLIVFMYLNEEFEISKRHFEVGTVGEI